MKKKYPLDYLFSSHTRNCSPPPPLYDRLSRDFSLFTDSKIIEIMMSEERDFTH